MNKHDSQFRDEVRDLFHTPPQDPIPSLRAWFDRAIEAQVREPNLMALATTDADGFASNRIVHLLEIRHELRVFATHSDSQKGRDIAATGWASAVIYWRETQQQVIVSGPAMTLSDEESDVLWFTRPLDARPMSVVSHQSEILQDEDALRVHAQSLSRLGISLTRPERWRGYGLMTRFLEFWQASPDRLHRRLRYERHPKGWTHVRLQP